VGGTLGAMRLTLNGEATGTLAQADAALLRVTGRLDADDGGALVRLLALDRVLAVAWPASLLGDLLPQLRSAVGFI